jgi:hypothetical protein
VHISRQEFVPAGPEDVHRPAVSTQFAIGGAQVVDPGFGVLVGSEVAALFVDVDVADVRVEPRAAGLEEVDWGPADVRRY